MYDDYTFPFFCQRHKRDVLLSVTLPHGLFPIYPMVQFIVMKRHETGLLSLGGKPVEKRKLSQFQDCKNIQLALLGNVGEKLIVWTFFCRGHESGIAFGNNWCWDFLASTNQPNLEHRNAEKIERWDDYNVKCLRIIITWNIFFWAMQKLKEHTNPMFFSSSKDSTTVIAVMW